MLDWIRFGLSTALCLFGLFVLVTGVLGVFRFRYSLNRIHAAALLDTLGILSMLGSVMIAFGWTLTSLKLLIVIAFLWLTSPVASHLIGELSVTTDDDLEQHLAVDDPDMVAQLKEGK